MLLSTEWVKICIINIMHQVILTCPKSLQISESFPANRLQIEVALGKNMEGHVSWPDIISVDTCDLGKGFSMFMLLLLKSFAD